MRKQKIWAASVDHSHTQKKRSHLTWLADLTWLAEAPAPEKLQEY
jgi:hypothetical protein